MYQHKGYSEFCLILYTWPLEHATGATVGSEQLDPAGQIVHVIFPVVSA